MNHKFIMFFLLSFSTYLFSQENHADLVDGPFDTPQEVTETCLMCHGDVEEAIMSTRHWKWLGDEFESENGEKLRSGKQNLVNNFCIGISSNWPRCTSCHISYGWKDESFDFDDPNNIDCLVCHDQTGTYQKSPTGAGMPIANLDLTKIAQSVGPSKRSNCGACHFNGGGGTGVKHGDLDESLLNPSAELDVHMGGADFECSECHSGEDHQILGASHGSMMEGTNRLNCESCHEEDPHSKKILNKHVNSVACETCHIPTIAREIPTKVWWDWSTAGKDKKTEPDEFGMPVYNKKKGDFIWGKNIIPEYTWHNGKATYYQLGDKINGNEPLKLNKLSGTFNDPNSKIAPFKVMRGKQIIDAENNYVIVPKLFGDGGFWKTFDWNNSAKLGMESVGIDYSGKYDFIETEMYWPLNHMVVPADQALSCTSCHGRKGKKRLDWNKLGYKTDPMKSGGRSLK